MYAHVFYFDSVPLALIKSEAIYDIISVYT
jgi:hypothetical protein